MMNFIKRNDNFFVEGFTDKGYKIYFVEIPQDKIFFYEPNNLNIIMQANNDIIITHKPTRIVLYSNIIFSSRMIEKIEKYHIIKIIGLCNNNQQIIAYPIAGFNYDRLKDILSDFTDKSGL